MPSSIDRATDPFPDPKPVHIVDMHGITHSVVYEVYDIASNYFMEFMAGSPGPTGSFAPFDETSWEIDKAVARWHPE